MKKLSVLLISAAFLGFFSCASKPEPQLEADISSSENKEAVIEDNSEPITEPEVLEDHDQPLEEIQEPDVTELPPEEVKDSEDDEITYADEAENLESDEDAALNGDEEAGDDTVSQEGDEKADSENEASEESRDLTKTENQAEEEGISDAEENSEAGDNTEENLEENSEDDLEINENDENTEITEGFPISRSVTLKVSEYLDISYPGSGWIYMGATDNSKTIIYFGRKLGTQNTNFSLQARLPGTKILHFYKNDNLTNQIIDDYIEVKVLEERGNSQTHIEAPEYKMPVKASRPAAKAAPITEESQSFPETDNQADEVISLVGDEAKKTSQKPKTSAKKETTPAPAASAEKTQAVQTAAVAQAQSQTQSEVQKTTESDSKNLLSDAQNKFTQKDYKAALNAVNEYLSNSKDKRDEALFLQGQILEAKSDLQDIAKAIDSYTTLTKNYPASKYWDKANKRIIYLKRFYLQGR